MPKNTRAGFYIWQIKQLSDRVFERLLKEHGIQEFNGPQGRILYVLWQKDNISITELGQKTSLAKTTLTSMLDRMELQGHIQRNFDKEDRRQIRITLTDKARMLSVHYEKISQKMNDLFYRDLSDNEFLQFETTLEKVLNNLKTADA